MIRSKWFLLVIAMLLALVVKWQIVQGYGDKEEEENHKTPDIRCKSKYQFPSQCPMCHQPPYGDVLPRRVNRINETIIIPIKVMDFDNLKEDLFAVKRLGSEIKHIVIELFSYGGSVFDAMAMTSLIAEREAAGQTVEIKARGIVASAGVIILVSGTRGMRFLDPSTLVMLHELSALKIAFETPSDKEEEARIYKKIQDNINGYIVSRSNITMEELQSKIKKKEFWLSATEAIQYGFADGFIK